MKNNKSTRKITLEIVALGKTFSIPFSSIENIDQFTVQFKDYNDLAKVLFGKKDIRIFDIRINYIYKQPGNNGKIEQRFLPIKFNGDNFDEIDLKNTLYNFMLRNPREIIREKWGLIYGINSGRAKSGRVGEITQSELSLAIDRIWNKGYKTKRDIYFNLKQNGIKVKINPKELYSNNHKKNNNSIKNFKSDDSYVTYLQSYSKQGNDEYDLAIEQLSMFNIEELTKMNYGDANLFDGATIQTNEETYDLDNITDNIISLSPSQRSALIEEIYLIRNEALNKNAVKKRCKK